MGRKRKWHLAPALVTFQNQVNAAFPYRDKRSDGTLGDARHRAEGSGSDHNPDASGSVNAIDITNGPYWHHPTVDGRTLADQLVASHDSRIKYVIFQRQIWEPGIGWHHYDGVSPHLEHVHLSVTEEGKNDGRSWWLPMFGATPAPPAPTPQPLPIDMEDDEVTSYIRNAQTGEIVRVCGNTYSPLTAAEWDLEKFFHAQSVDFQPAQFALALSSRSQTGHA